jgi:short-subunit dehydrogenase
VIGFSEALRSELKPHGITVSVLCPPDTDTPGFAQENTTKPPETHAVSAGAKVMTAEQVADALFAGMAKRAPLIVPGFDGKVSALMKRLAPGLVERVMDRAIARARTS